MSATVDSELPRYTEIARDTARVVPDSAGSSRPFKSEFKTGLQDEKGYAWLVLRVQSRSPSASSVPFFTEGDTISGVVELDAAKTDSVKAVFIEVRMFGLVREGY